ncbi:GASR-like protein [Mya arenaria]|uniref:GASR-like protein n=1 Tax=Mya arenaria TaxID=6604 RepID=A0ABY7F0Z9_MYAAR|nr:GASR-like protein [Mya arenaria]
MYQKVGRFLESDENEANLTLEELNDELFQYHIPAIVFVIISMVVGVFGNTLVILIYKTKFRRSNHRYFILFLAVTDFVACVTGMPFLVASLRLPYLMTSSVTCKTLRYFHYFVNNCSGLLLVVIAIERFRKIVRPFKRQLTTRQTLYLCYGTMFISAIMAVPAPIYFDATDIDTGVQNITGKQCYVSPSSKKGFEMFNFILMLEAFASMVIFAVLYSLIVRKLCTSDQFVQAMKSMRSVSSMDSGRKGINSLEDHSVDIMDTETPTHSEISQEPSVKGAVSLKSSTQTEYTSNDNGTTQSTVSLNTDVESRNNGHVTGRNARALWRKSVDLIGRNNHNEKQNVVTRAQSDKYTSNIE